MGARRRRDRRAALGRHGERLAALYLRWRGYRILARDLRTPVAQLDLLARHGDVLCVVEVKSTRGPAGPVLVGGPQRRRLIRAARWLAGCHPATGIRIDVIHLRFPRRLPWWIGCPRIRHLEDTIADPASWWS